MSSYAGTVTSFTRGGTTFHTYTAPEAGFRVNSHLVETASEVSLIDAQLALPFADEVVSLIKEIGKPLARIIITHGHPDHFSGLQVVHGAFPAAPIFAIKETRDYMTEWAQPVLDARRAAFGDIIAEHAVYPTDTLERGQSTLGELTISVEEVDETEAHAQALITFPAEKVLAAADTVVAPGHHLFLVVDGDDNIPNWVALLETIAARTDIDIVLTGHGPTTDPATSTAAAIDWLKTARSARAAEAEATGYAEIIKSKYPDYHDPIWADFGSQMLYGLINP